MEERSSGGLAPWILLPLVLLVVMFFATSLLPTQNCDVTDHSGASGRAAFAVIAGICSLVTGVVAIVRFVDIRQNSVFVPRDAWLGGLTLLALAVGADIGDVRGGSEAALAGALLAGMGVMLLSLLGLIAAAFTGRDAEDVGALVPIYLGGACLTYPLLAWIVLDVNAGGLC
jgi:hypothetical protein